MGNKNSGSAEPTALNFTPRDETERTYTRPPMPLPHHLPPSPAFPKRSYTMVETRKLPEVYTQVAPTLVRAGSASSLRPLTSTNSMPKSLSSDDLADHIIETTPKDNSDDVPLSASIVVTFDKDVRTVNVNKLFEVSCDSHDSNFNPIKGRVNYEARQMKAEFIPDNTLFPNSNYTVTLNGKAVTTAQCSHSANIKDISFSFRTSNPPPKSVGIRLKGQLDAEQLQIANYYYLYNSLINWSTKKWGCSDEHIIGLYSECDGKLTQLKADLDVLNVKDDEVIVVEIKD